MTITNLLTKFTLLLLLTVGFSSCIDKFKPRKEVRTECPLGISPTRRILFIGWDGVRSDALQTANTPHLDSLLTDALVDYHVDRGPFTVSTPGWSTLLHGVWPDKHGLTENSFRKNKYDDYPDIFHIIRQQNPNFGLATLSNWDAFLQITSEETFAQRYDTDPDMVAEALNLLDACPPDVMLMHFDYTDATGHRFGFSPQSQEYLSSIEIADHYLGKLMAKIKAREAQYAEEWMVVVTTDHGGEGTGHGDQEQLDQTRFVWHVVRAPGFAPTLLTNGKSVDILPTMLKWLNFPTSELNLDGNSLF